MTQPGTIVMPIAGRSSRFPGMRPKWMLAAPSGEMMLQLSLRSIPDWSSHNIVIGALEDHLESLGGRTAIRRALGEDVRIVSFPTVTKGPAETVTSIIETASVQGSIFIKDCDSWFDIDGDVFDDIICIADLRNLPNLRNVAAKSFVGLNGQGLVTGIIEKSISSNYISVGGYGFHDAEGFVDAFQKLSSNGFDGEPFISHVILEAMHGGNVFRGLTCRNYEDVGTLEAWNAFRVDRQAYFIDLDGIVFRNAGEFIPPFWDDPDTPLSRNIEALRHLSARGAQLTFVTARPERYRMKTEAALTTAGLTWHAIVFGVHHSRRVLINDYGPTNPYPSAVALNSARNDDNLNHLLHTGP